VRSVSLAYLRIERVDYLLVVDLVWIVPLLSLLIHRNAGKRHRRDVQYESRVR